MKIKTERKGDKQDVKRVYITIKEAEYILTESIDGKLTIHKTEWGNDSISIYPRVTNVIEIN